MGAKNNISSQPIECATEILLQIAYILQSNIQPHDAVPIIRTSGRGMKIVRNRQASYPGPAIPDLKKLQLVYEFLNLRFAEPRLKCDRKHARRSRKVALPEFMPRTGRKRRVQDTFDLRRSLNQRAKEEAEDLASQGVSTVFMIWSPRPGTALGGQKNASMDYSSEDELLMNYEFKLLRDFHMLQSNALAGGCSPQSDAPRSSYSDILDSPS
jgi:hypothetical protein